MLKNIFLTFTFFQFISNFKFKCGTDSIKKKPHFLEDTNNKGENNKRNLQVEYTPIKIYVDYTTLYNQNLFSSSEIRSLENIFEEVIQYFSSLLSVQHTRFIIQEYMIPSFCDIIFFSRDLLNIIEDYDLLLFPMINEDLDEYVLAQAWTCIYSGERKPMVGIVEISPYFTLNKFDISYHMKYLLLHEITHILGFSATIFKHLNIIYVERKNGITKEYINSTKVIEKAKIHFNCKNIKGIELENQGQEGEAGSHWDARYMLGDYMISTNYPEMTISDITLAFLEDTGFYKANYYTGGLFRYGKNQGCSFLEEDCVSMQGTSFPNEFCIEPGGYFCGSSHINRGDCYIIEYEDIITGQFRYFDNKYAGGFLPADYCPVSYNYYEEKYENISYYPFNCNFGLSLYPSLGEEIGKNSICFESTLLSSSNILNSNNANKLNESLSVCYKIGCDRKRKQINVTIGEEIITCPTKGTILRNPKGFFGTIKCPDYNLVCTSEIWCNELFDCIDKKSVADGNTYDYNNYRKIVLDVSKIILWFILFIINGF